MQLAPDGYLSGAAFRAPNLGLSTMFLFDRKSVLACMEQNSAACVWPQI